MLARFFDLAKLEFWPLRPPDLPGVQGSNFISLFPAHCHEGHTLSIWFGYYEWFPRSFVTYIVMNKAKSTSKYLLDVYKTAQTHFFVFWGAGASHCKKARPRFSSFLPLRVSVVNGNYWTIAQSRVILEVDMIELAKWIT